MISHKGHDYSVIAVTPAGREKSLLILNKYLEREMKSGLLDGWQLWCNTNVQKDIDCMMKLSSENPKIEMKLIEGQGAYDGYRIHLFFKFAQDENTIYVRFDDDIVFLEKGALKKLILCRLENPGPFIVCANIVNNTMINAIHQDMGVLTKHAGVCNYTRLDPIAWEHPAFAEHVHKTFQSKYAQKLLSEYYLPGDWKFTQYEPFSISCFAFFGKDHFKPDRDEEMWISSWKPAELQRPNIVCPNALVVHYAYHPQRSHLESKPEYFEYYQNLTKNIYED
jgi:hypothetical protein